MVLWVKRGRFRLFNVHFRPIWGVNSGAQMRDTIFTPKTALPLHFSSPLLMRRVREERETPLVGFQALERESERNKRVSLGFSSPYPTTPWKLEDWEHSWNPRFGGWGFSKVSLGLSFLFAWFGVLYELLTHKWLLSLFWLCMGEMELPNLLEEEDE